MIPRVLHFVWAGGARIVPDDGLRNIAGWAAANPDFDVRLWVDEKTDPDRKARLRTIAETKIQQLSR